MNTKLVHLLGVEMRRALHRRLVRWMIAVALLLCPPHGHARRIIPRTG